MSGGRGRFKLKFKVKTVRITNSIAIAGTTGQATSVTLTANVAIETWTLLSGTNVQVISGVMSVLDTSAAGSFSGTVKGTDYLGRYATATVTFTLTGSAVLGQVTGLSVVSTTTSVITLNFNSIGAATFYQAAIDRDTNKPRTLGAGKTVGVSVPGNAYIVQVRAGDGSGNYGAWSAEVTANVADLSSAGPAAVQTPIRASVVAAAIVPQFHFNLDTADYPFLYAWNANGTITDGTFSAGGWVKDHLEPLVNVGLKYYRTLPGGHAKTTDMGAVLARNLKATYGLMMHATLNYNTFAAATPTVVLNNIRNAAKGNFASAIYSVAGLNEPNNPAKTATYPTNWKDEVIAHHIAIDAALTAGGTSYSSVLHYSFSVWGRLSTDIDALLAYTDASSRTWAVNVAPLLDAANLHAYNNGRIPTVYGAPTGTSEGGAALDEVSLSWTIDDLVRLSTSGSTLPVVDTESGWGRDNGIAANTGYVSIDTSRKYAQRLLFENLLLGVTTTVYFQFFQTDLDYDWQQVDYSISGGVCAFTRLSPYTTMLNTLTAFYDSGGTASTFTVSNLNFTLSADAGSPNDYDQRIHHKLFQKSIGVWLLAIWYDNVSWNRNTKAESFGSRTVKLTINSGAKAIRTNRPYTNTTWTTVGTLATTLLTVNDDVLVVEIT